MPMNREPDTDIRVPVSAHLQPKLRLYRRLWLAEIDLEEAKAALDEILRARIPISRRERASPLLLSLTTALVVAYSRPWVYSRGQSVAERTVPASLLRSLTARQRAVHDFLVELRNKEMAHSDADILDLHLRLHPDGHSAILRTSHEPFRRSELKEIRRIIEKLETAIAHRCEELRPDLPNEEWI
jgi:hypothetical protein